jgi:uncharacterized protein
MEVQEMRTIIAGGGGMIGRQLINSLTAGGHEAIVLSRNPDKVHGLPAGARAVRWDGRSTQGWGELADGAHAIINLAGRSLNSGRWTAAAKQAIRQSRVDAGTAITEAVRAAVHKPAVVIQQSGIGHYGIHADDIVTEESPAGADFMASVTLDWEAATAPVEQMGVRRVVTRSAFVLGKDNLGLTLMLLPFRFFVGGPVGSGRQWFPWIHIADEVSAMRFLIDNASAGGAFNLAAPNPVTNAEFGRTIGKALHRPSFIPAPAFALRLLLGEMATVVLDGQRAVPQRLQKLGYQFRFPDAESALRDLLR